MHTFEVSCNIPPSVYRYLHDNLPNLVNVSQCVERTNYYSAKGITQIELRIHEYFKYGVQLQKYFLVLRCNPSIIMGDGKVFLLDMEKYTSAEVLAKLQKRIHEINEMRYVRLDKQPVSIFSANRADVAKDIIVDFPQLVIWLCNMSFPFKYHNMERKPIRKDRDMLYIESCCFSNGSREINIYHKFIELINNHKMIPSPEEERIQRTVRLEIQIRKRGIYNMKLPTKRSIKPFLEKDFCTEYLKKEIRSIFGIYRFVSRKKAVDIINNSQYKPYDKAVMLSIITMIHQFRGLYELEKSIDDVNINTPLQYGDLKTFRTRWLKKFYRLGISPVVLPDVLNIDEMPSIYELLTNN
jgi:hypothetical protein